MTVNSGACIRARDGARAGDQAIHEDGAVYNMDPEPDLETGRRRRRSCVWIGSGALAGAGA